MKNDKKNIMIKFWGVRGSIPVPGRKFVKYGGNTSCVEVRCNDTILVFDAGTGMRELGRSLIQEFAGQPVEMHIFISHTHWDHIQGFPFLDLSYIKNNRIFLYGGHSVSNLEKLILGQMEREYFPVTLFELAADVKFVEFKENPFYINGIKIYFTHLFHPALALGYRIEYRDRVIVYATDNEILDDPEMKNYNIANLGNVIKNADVLITDCQYTKEEYTKKIGWGHSSIDMVVDVCREFGVKNLFAFHHDPWRTDREIDAMINDARKLAGNSLRVYGAREKTVIYL